MDHNYVPYADMLVEKISACHCECKAEILNIRVVFLSHSIYSSFIPAPASLFAKTHTFG